MDERTTDIRGILALVAIALALLAGLVALAWWGMSHVGPNAARIWALSATLLVPVACWVGYRLGSRRVAETEAEARGTLVGLEAGVRQVMTAAAQTADLRISTVREVHRVQREGRGTTNVLVLPQPSLPFTMRRALPAGDDGDLVD